LIVAGPSRRCLLIPTSAETPEVPPLVSALLGIAPAQEHEEDIDGTRW
jgi:hypothetical protein